MLTETQRFFKMWYFFFVVIFTMFVSLTPVLERNWMNLTIWLADTEHAGCKQDRGCTCTVFLFGGHSSCILQLLAFIRQKARMNPPANSHERKKTKKQKAFWKGENPRGHAAMAQNAMYSIFIFIYIYIIYTKQHWHPNKCQTPHSTQSQNKDRPTFFIFFLNKKKLFFCSFLCKSATQLK